MPGHRFFLLLLIAALPLPPAPHTRTSAAPAALDLAGHWEAPVSGDGRTFIFLFDFATKGDVLTGTVGISSRDDIFPITDGKIKGNTISFKAFGIWTGELSGKDLKLTRGLDYGKKQTMVAHRTKQ